MAYADQQMSGNRVVAIIIVALIHIALGYALITGLAYEAGKKLIERVTTVDVEEPPPPEPEDEPPPPPPDENAPPPPVAPPPPINIAPAPPPIVTQTQIPPPAPIFTKAPPAAPPAPPAPPAVNKTRGASSKGSWPSQLQRNYPRKAEREGAEGSVGVACTITPDGRAEGCSVTRSSGNADLDAGAIDGVQRYGRFNPALDAAGNPVSGRFSTTIQYKLN